MTADLYVFLQVVWSQLVPCDHRPEGRSLHWQGCGCQLPHGVWRLPASQSLVKIASILPRLAYCDNMDVLGTSQWTRCQEHTYITPDLLSVVYEHWTALDYWHWSDTSVHRTVSLEMPLCFLQYIMYILQCMPYVVCIEFYISCVKQNRLRVWWWSKFTDIVSDGQRHVWQHHNTAAQHYSYQLHCTTHGYTDNTLLHQVIQIQK